MIIKKSNYGNFHAVTPLPGEGWVATALAGKRHHVIKITSSGEVIDKGDGLLIHSPHNSQARGLCVRGYIDYFGLSPEGDLISPYSEADMLEIKFCKKYKTKVIDGREKVIASVLGMKKGEVGLAFLNRKTEESKLLVIHEGAFHAEGKIDITVSADGATALVWQSDCDNTAFVIVDLDV